MSKVTVTESYLEGIGDAIRNKLNTSQGYTPGQMAAAIQSIPTGGITPTGTINITQNGTADVTQYATADVNVPNSYAAGDEGKVVQNGALVAQTSETVTQNGTYDTTTKNEIVVNVQGGGTPNLQDKTITQNGTYTADAGYDGLGTVTVSVSGGGSSNLYEFDYTKYSGTVDSVQYSTSGARFSSSNSAIFIPFLKNGMNIEMDVAEMALNANENRRFFMVTYNKGLVYRNTGAWGLYGTSWEMSDITDGSFFDDCTVKINIDSTGKWHIYKDGVLVWEPSTAVSAEQSYEGDYTKGLCSIGSGSGTSINNALITGVRVY